MDHVSPCHERGLLHAKDLVKSRDILVVQRHGDLYASCRPASSDRTARFQTRLLLRTVTQYGEHDSRTLAGFITWALRCGDLITCFRVLLAGLCTRDPGRSGADPFGGKAGMVFKVQIWNLGPSALCTISPRVYIEADRWGQGAVKASRKRCRISSVGLSSHTSKCKVVQMSKMLYEYCLAQIRISSLVIRFMV